MRLWMETEQSKALSTNKTWQHFIISTCKDLTGIQVRETPGSSRHAKFNLTMLNSHLKAYIFLENL